MAVSLYFKNGYNYYMRNKCYTCMRPETSCMCQYMNPLDTQTKFVILMHPMEFKKEKNGTGFLTRGQLSNSEVIMGLNFTHDKKVNDYLQNYDCYILYPGADSLNLSLPETKLLSTAKQRVIFIIDGTWACAKKMLKLSLNLHSVTKISFNTDLLSQFKIKQQPNPACLSTIESTKVLLDQLKAKNIEDINTFHFLKPFEKMIEYQVEMIKNPPPSSYRTNGRGVIKMKNMYKTDNGRKLFFEEKEFEYLKKSS